jgi:hypothetical protein
MLQLDISSLIRRTSSACYGLILPWFVHRCPVLDKNTDGAPLYKFFDDPKLSRFELPAADQADAGVSGEFFSAVPRIITAAIIRRRHH